MPKLEDELTMLRKKVDTLTRLVEEGKRSTADSAVDYIRTTARGAGEKLRHYVDESPLKEKYDHIKDGIGEASHKVEENVHQHPLLSLGIAFIVGLGISALFNRKG